MLFFAVGALFILQKKTKPKKQKPSIKRRFFLAIDSFVNYDELIFVKKYVHFFLSKINKKHQNGLFFQERFFMFFKKRGSFLLA